MKGEYTLEEATRQGLIKPGDTITVYFLASRTRLTGIYTNPIPGLDIGNPGGSYPLSPTDLILKVNGVELFRS